MSVPPLKKKNMKPYRYWSDWSRSRKELTLSMRDVVQAMKHTRLWPKSLEIGYIKVHMNKNIPASPLTNMELIIEIWTDRLRLRWSTGEILWGRKMGGGGVVQEKRVSGFWIRRRAKISTKLHRINWKITVVCLRSPDLKSLSWYQVVTRSYCYTACVKFEYIYELVY